MKRLFLPLGAACTLILLYSFAWRGQQQRADLVIYAYPSFVAAWGAGPKLVEKYQLECACRVELVEAGHSALLVQRLIAEEHLPRADLVIGLDQHSLSAARKLMWQPMPELRERTVWDKRLPAPPRQADFLPVDWAPLVFIRRGALSGAHKPQPTSLRDLLKPEFKQALSLEDPRSSALGFQFVAWGVALWGAPAGGEFLTHLQPQVFAWSPSWSTAYGFFKQGQAQMAFSYLTSLIYHWHEEKDRSYQPVVFRHPHPYQIEYVGVPQACRNCARAKDFVGFLLRPDAQKIFAEGNYMLPSVAQVELNPVYRELPQVSLLGDEDTNWAQAHRSEILDMWKRANPRVFGDK